MQNAIISLSSVIQSDPVTLGPDPALTEVKRCFELASTVESSGPDSVTHHHAERYSESNPMKGERVEKGRISARFLDFSLHCIAPW